MLSCIKRKLSNCESNVLNASSYKAFSKVITVAVKTQNISNSFTMLSKTYDQLNVSSFYLYS